MQTLDYIVLGGYFLLMVGIGILCSLRIKKQEDFFMGGRGFGKLLQTFAAFGAGTGSHDPINVGRTTWSSGLSGIWSALMWLFVTPFYWITAVWYRRMRHLTLGDWWVERYESKGMGAGYTAFAFVFQVLYLSTMFSAISKVAQPLLGDDSVQWITGLIGSADPGDLRFVLIPTIAVVVIAYGVLGGLAAAYWTDLIQGLCIIVLSVVLIPAGLYQLVDRYGADYQVADGGASVEGLGNGFSIMHERLSGDYFQLFGGPLSSEFPLHYIIAITVLGLVGIVVQPHFIATGGGSAKTENSARIGLVTGNFLKRFCTIGWALTALIALALLASNLKAIQDPDEIWGLATKELLAPLSFGLVGLMLACLLAAMMSSADCYMLISSALFVRNLYAAYVAPNASEKHYIAAGRIASFFVIFGAATIAMFFYDVFGQYVLSLEFAAMFGAPFWLGIWWRGATKWGAVATILLSLGMFFALPSLLPKVVPGLRESPAYTMHTDVLKYETTRIATPVDADRRKAEIQGRTKLEESIAAAVEERNAKRFFLEVRDDSGRLETPSELKAYNDAVENLRNLRSKTFEISDEPKTKKLPLETGDSDTFERFAGGDPIFWSGGLKRDVDSDRSEPKYLGEPEVSRNSNDNEVKVTRMVKQGSYTGQGSFRWELAVYSALGVDLTKVNKATLSTLSLIPKLTIPFLLMIVFSLITPPGTKAGLDRYYAKMRTPVMPDPEDDERELAASYANPDRHASKRLFNFWGLEIQKPNAFDVAGFVICVAICFVFLAIAYWVANLGAY